MKPIPACVLSALLLTGCAEALVPEVSVSPLMPSVLEVRWTRVSDGAASVRFGEDLDRSAPEISAPGSDEVRVLIVGAPSGEVLSMQAVEEGGGSRAVESARFEATPGLLIDAPPPLTVSVAAAESLDDRLLLTTAVGEDNGPMLVNRWGEVLWFWPLPAERMVIDVEVDAGGQGLWALTMNQDFSEEWAGRLLRIGWDGALEVDLDVPGGHHAFTQLGDGRVAIVREVDLVAADDSDGWNSEVVAMTEDGEEEVLADLMSFSPGSTESRGETRAHSNGLIYLPHRDTLLWSFGALGAVAEVNASTGEQVWGVGRLDQAFPWATPDTAPSMLHSPSITADDELMLFDNGDEDRDARVVSFILDVEAMEARESWEYVWSGEDQIFTLGHVRFLPDGHLLVSWGQRGQLEELNAEGETIWLASSVVGSALGNVQRVDALWPTQASGQGRR